MPEKKRRTKLGKKIMLFVASLATCLFMVECSMIVFEPYLPGGGLYLYDRDLGFKVNPNYDSISTIVHEDSKYGINNAISTYLRQSTQAYLLGFNPMWQFVHETDMLDALMQALEGDPVGVYNVAGRGELPIMDALELTGATLLPFPAPIASVILRLSRSMPVPPYFLDFLKYHCVISDAKFREDFGCDPNMGPRETIESTVHGV